MNVLIICAAGLTFSTLIGGGIGMVCKKAKGKFYNLMLVFAAGIMLYASMSALILPAFETDDLFGFTLATAGLIIGTVTVSLIESAPSPLIKLVMPDKNPDSEQTRTLLIFITAALLHKLPEGIASGVSCAVGDDVAVSLSLGLAVQNIPDGLVVAAPLSAAGVKRSRVFAVVCLTAAFSAVGMAFGYLSASLSLKILNFALSLAGGMMIYVSCSLLNQSEFDKYSGTAFSAGIIILELIGRIVK